MRVIVEHLACALRDLHRHGPGRNLEAAGEVEPQHVRIERVGHPRPAQQRVRAVAPRIDAELELVERRTQRHLQVELNLGESCEVTDGGLAYLKGLTNLEELNLSGTRIEGEGLVFLTGMTKLRKATSMDTGQR